MKNRYLFLTVFSLLIFKSIYAQKHDNIWMLGYHGQNPHPLQNNMFVNFTETPNTIEGLELDSGLSLGDTNTSICDADGNLLFYTNGINIFNSSHSLMENGDKLSYFGTVPNYQDDGLFMNQGIIALPLPNHPNKYVLFHESTDFEPGGLGTHFPFLFKSEVDMTLNGGLGAVTEKNSLLIEDTLAGDKLIAAKHGNGQDWWVLVPESEDGNQGIYKFLVSPEGIELIGKQEDGLAPEIAVGAVGNAIFTPDGSKYIRQDIRFDPWNVIDIYDFDRCTGELVHLEHFEIEDTSFLYGGAAVSPDSKYLYTVTTNVIYQFDLSALDIESTKTVVAEYDGFVGLLFGTVFGTPQLAPDGTIWISTVSDTVMHVIRTPNQAGILSHVDQHSVHLPRINQKSIPNHPNYRLGPLDGSPCDTLGLDNFPVAGFAHFAEELSVTFSDNSHYRPETWEWDFGDSNGSTERNPIHAYNEPGEYEVCLTVANENGGDTFCRWVEVDTVAVVSTVETVLEGGVELFPNPASTQIKLRLEKPLPNASSLELYDPAGRRVKTWSMAAHREQGVFWLGRCSQGALSVEAEKRGEAVGEWEGDGEGAMIDAGLFSLKGVQRCHLFKRSHLLSK